MKCEWFVKDKPCDIDDNTVQPVAIKRYSGETETKTLCKKHASEYIGHAFALWEADRIVDAKNKREVKREAPNLFNQ